MIQEKILKISISEYEKSEKSFTIESNFKELSNSKFFSLIVGDKAGEYKIEASQYVGSYQIGDITININPKIGSLDFIKMLLEGDGEGRAYFNEALNNKNDELNILDLLANTLAQEILHITSNCLNRDYIEKEENLKFLRGALLVGQDLVKNITDRSNMYCRYTEFSADTSLNQSLKWAIETLRVSLTLGQNDLVNRASRSMSEISMLSVCPIIDLRSSPVEYRKALRIVQWLKEFIILSHGDSDFCGSGIFVDMNKVFEGFVRERLRRVAKKYNYFVPTKEGSKRDLCHGVGLKPDILICDSKGTAVSIIDCKYKKDWNNINGDVFQILAYLEAFKSTKNAYIIFPRFAKEAKEEDLRPLDLPRGRQLFKVPIDFKFYFDDNFWEKTFLELTQKTDGVSSDFVGRNGA